MPTGGGITVNGAVAKNLQGSSQAAGARLVKTDTEHLGPMNPTCAGLQRGETALQPAQQPSSTGERRGALSRTHLIVKATVVQNLGSGFTLAPDPHIFLISNIVFRRQHIEPEITAPDQFAKSRLVFAEAGFMIGVAPGLEKVQRAFTTAIEDHAAIELGK